MANDNLCLLCVIVIICVLLMFINKTDANKVEGYDNTGSVSKPLVANDTSNSNKMTEQNIIDNVASSLVNNTNTINNLNTIPNIKQDAVKDSPIDIFKDTATLPQGIPAPHNSNIKMRTNVNDGYDTNMSVDLNELIKKGTILTSDNLLPNDKEENEYNAYKLAVPYNDSNLTSNGLEKFGVDTIGSSKRIASLDIRGNVPCPKFKVSPWHNSSYEPDFNIKGIYA